MGLALNGGLGCNLLHTLLRWHESSEVPDAAGARHSKLKGVEPHSTRRDKPTIND
jgi:hypothetical protein